MKTLLEKSDIPAEYHEDIDSAFVGMCSILVVAMETTAPNFLTFAMTMNSIEYELTFRKVGGKTPAQEIEELRARIKELEDGPRDNQTVPAQPDG